MQKTHSYSVKVGRLQWVCGSKTMLRKILLLIIRQLQRSRKRRISLPRGVCWKILSRRGRINGKVFKFLDFLVALTGREGG